MEFDASRPDFEHCMGGINGGGLFVLKISSKCQPRETVEGGGTDPDKLLQLFCYFYHQLRAADTPRFRPVVHSSDLWRSLIDILTYETRCSPVSPMIGNLATATRELDGGY